MIASMETHAIPAFGSTLPVLEDVWKQKLSWTQEFPDTNLIAMILISPYLLVDAIHPLFGVRRLFTLVVETIFILTP